MKIKNKIISIKIPYKYLAFFSIFILLFSILIYKTTYGDISNVLTEDATNITATGAKLWGSMSPGAQGAPGSANAYFRYSALEYAPPLFCNDIFGSKMKATNEVPIWGSTQIEVHATVSDLAPDTTYYYCMIGSNNDEISSTGGVKSFTTATEGVSVETKDALVINKTSVDLNGHYNAAIPAETWFEYKKDGTGEQNNNNTTTNPAYNWSDPIGKIKRNSSTSDDMTFPLTGLSPSTKYQFRAVIEPLSSTRTTYGTILVFTTKDSSGSNNDDGSNSSGTPYINPCLNTDDTNCNGTGGDGTVPTTNGLPDLKAGNVTPNNAVINTPTILSAKIINRGGGSTNKSFYSFFQISTIYRGNGTPGGTTGNGTVNSVPTTNTQNNITSFLKNILSPEKVMAAVNTNNTPPTATPPDPTLINLPPVLTPTLGSGVTTNVTTSYTFTSLGTYYARACADKKSLADFGLIKESIENNNCGSWVAIKISSSSLPTVGICAPTHWSCSAGTSINNTGNASSGWTWVCSVTANPTLDSAKNAYCAEGGSSTGCPNGATNPPTCTVGPGGYCLNGATNPPTCTITGTGCSNGAINPTLCTTGSGGNCLNGAINPPTCDSFGNNNLGGNTNNNTNNNNTGELHLGDTATPPDDAIVRYHEGIEHVFVRQIVKNTDIAKMYGYTEGTNLLSFAWNLADKLAREFGYVSASGKEIRVSVPDIAAYQLKLNGNILTVYEYYNSKIVNIESTTTILRSIYEYEYYFTKK